MVAPRNQREIRIRRVPTFFYGLLYGLFAGLILLNTGELWPGLSAIPALPLREQFEVLATTIILAVFFVGLSILTFGYAVLLFCPAFVSMGPRHTYLVRMRIIVLGIVRVPNERLRNITIRKSASPTHLIKGDMVFITVETDGRTYKSVVPGVCLDPGDLASLFEVQANFNRYIDAL